MRDPKAQPGSTFLVTSPVACGSRASARAFSDQLTAGIAGSHVPGTPPGTRTCATTLGQIAAGLTVMVAGRSPRRRLHSPLITVNSQ